MKDEQVSRVRSSFGAAVPRAPRLFGLVLCALLLPLYGCGGESSRESRGAQVESPTPEPAAAVAEPGGGAAPTEEAGPVAQDDSFELRATAAGPYTAGQPGTFEIRLVPRGDYHVNADPAFPFAIALGGPDAVRFAEPSLDRDDAAEFNEQRASFAVPFTPQQAGQHRVTATVDFAVCTPTTCLPEQRTLALVLPVQ
jgi:hypothetical protein